MSIFTDSDSLAQQIGIAFVLAFLILLIVRYILLLWLGYLHHLENPRRTHDDLRKLCQAEGMRTLQEQSVRLATAGITTPAELMRSIYVVGA